LPLLPLLFLLRLGRFSQECKDHRRLGATAFRGDLRIKDGKIVKIGSIKPSKDDEVIDASGLVLAPGFIDIHNHSESGLVREGTAANQVSQGITTVMVGPDGGSPWPLADYLRS
jgi:N-acyl-D-amino-acid deacylase